MAVSVLSSVLPVSFCRSLGTAPETDQRLTLIHSEWSRRRDRELCDYWTLTLYQFQSFYNTRLSHTRCIMHSVWSPGIQSYGRYWSWGIFLHFSWGRRNFVIKSATGSNPLIASKDQGWRSERGTLPPVERPQLHWFESNSAFWETLFFSAYMPREINAVLVHVNSTACLENIRPYSAAG